MIRRIRSDKLTGMPHGRPRKSAHRRRAFNTKRGLTLPFGYDTWLAFAVKTFTPAPYYGTAALPEGKPFLIDRPKKMVIRRYLHREFLILTLLAQDGVRAELERCREVYGRETSVVLWDTLHRSDWTSPAGIDVNLLAKLHLLISFSGEFPDVQPGQIDWISLETWRKRCLRAKRSRTQKQPAVTA